jgi:hypothetical protein
MTWTCSTGSRSRGLILVMLLSRDIKLVAGAGFMALWDGSI